MIRSRIDFKPNPYYTSPQVWAWRPQRVRQIRQVVDRMLVILPFEEPFYRQHGVAAEFVGHPLVEELAFPADRQARCFRVAASKRSPGTCR